MLEKVRSLTNRRASRSRFLSFSFTFLESWRLTAQPVGHPYHHRSEYASWASLYLASDRSLKHSHPPKSLKRSYTAPSKRAAGPGPCPREPAKARIGFRRDLLLSGQRCALLILRGRPFCLAYSTIRDPGRSRPGIPIVILEAALVSPPTLRVL